MLPTPTLTDRETQADFRFTALDTNALYDVPCDGKLSLVVELGSSRVSMSEKVLNVG